jgi:broad specificity phosphatase PhoE
MATRIYLIRHGATALNLSVPYRLQGRRSDPPLDERGREQARRAGQALIGVRLDAVYSSPLRRAMETARLVGNPRGILPIPVEDLIEAEIGRWEGLTWDEARERDPDDYQRFHATPGTSPYPEGESFAEVAARVTPVLLSLAMGHPGAKIAVVAHNIVNRAVLAGPLGLSIDLARGIRQSNGGVNVLEAEAGTLKVACLNACLHLDGLD